jgi:hypothetical protein
MGLFGKDKNTIDDKKMADLQRRGRNADKESWFSKKAVDKRLASNAQHDKRKWS